jgi:hypothetical protein
MQKKLEEQRVRHETELASKLAKEAQELGC